MMKEMYLKYRNELKNKNKILLVVVIVFFIGLIFGSFYITILKSQEKEIILKKVSQFFEFNSKITFEDKINLFKTSLFTNLLYFISIWILGISIVGIPIILIMIFFKGFTVGFSLGSIFACYKFKGILGSILYIFPNIILICIFTLFLGTYSLKISINLLNTSFKKKSLNFGSFMGRYFFLEIIIILICIIISLLEAFICPTLLNLFTNFTK